MRTILVILCLASCLGAAAPAAGSAVGEIDRLLTAWHRAAAGADEAAYFAFLADDAVFLGTDARERWTKEGFREWAAPYFRRGSAWTFRAIRRQVALSRDGRVAWFDEDLVSPHYWPCRGSGVLERTGGRWRLRQYNLAFTIPNEATAAVKPLVEAALANQAGPGR